MVESDLLCLVPGDNGRETDLPHSGEECECGEDQRSNDEFILVQRLQEGVGLAAVSRLSETAWTHIYEFLDLWGPVYHWWCFPFERLIGSLQRLPTNNLFGV